MPTDFTKIRGYYAAFDEWGRLDLPDGAVELRRALDVLEQHLPAQSRVLDLGGGPGRYAVELARRGHRVTLADLSPVNLEEARLKIAEHGVEDRIDGVDEVNAVDLAGYADGAFDAVLVFGPFYHLTSEAERRQAAVEIRRVVRPGGLVFVAYVPRLSGLAGLIDRAAGRPGQVTPEVLAEAAATGVFRNQAAGGFQEGYYPRTGELEALLEACQLTLLDRVSLKSLLDGRAAVVGSLPPELTAAATDAALSVARDPAVLATCGHVLVVAERPQR